MVNWLQKQLEKHPDQPALYWMDECWTFAQVATEVQRWQAMYQKKLAPKSSRVALLSTNSKDMYFSILALWELDKEILFLNTHLQWAEIDFQLEDACVKELIVSADILDLTRQADKANYQIIEMDSTKLDKQTVQQHARWLETDIASIMYTSGTTGQPKGVPQTFGNHLASAKATAARMDVTRSDCWGCALPLFHISGLSIVMRQLALGCSIRLYPRFDSYKLTTDLVTGKLTILSVVPLMLKELLKKYPLTGYHQQFRTFLLGGAPIDKRTLEECQANNWTVLQSYGMTETCSQIVALTAADAMEKIGSVGRPLSGIELKIAAIDTQPLASNKVGEVLVRGDNIITHYINHQSSEKWTDDHWFHTGDLGYLDAQGYLYIVSRLSELIISGGENIYPVEVEQVLQKMPAIAEVAVVGELDDYWGATPVAYVVLQEPITLEDVQRFAAKELARYKLPKKLYICKKLPKTASGKVAKHRLMGKEREAYIIK